MKTRNAQQRMLLCEYYFLIVSLAVEFVSPQDWFPIDVIHTRLNINKYRFCTKYICSILICCLFWNQNEDYLKQMFKMVTSIIVRVTHVRILLSSW